MVDEVEKTMFVAGCNAVHVTLLQSFDCHIDVERMMYTHASSRPSSYLVVS